MMNSYWGSGPTHCGPSRQPDEAAALGLLQHLNKSELESLLNDDAKLEAHVRDLSQIKNLQDEKESCQATNKSLAEYNLSKESVLAERRAQLAASYNIAKKLHAEYAEQAGKLSQADGGQMNIDTALALIRTESERSEQLTEEIANAFLEGNTECDKFLQDFVRMSTQAHTQQIKAEKLHTIATRLRHGLPLTPKQQPQVAPRTNFYNSVGPAQPGNVPYSPGTGGTSYFKP